MDTSLALLEQARHYDPFSYLGLHHEKEQWVVRFYRPEATAAEIILDDGTQLMQRVKDSALFEWVSELPPPRPYRIRVYYGKISHEIIDPYQFPSTIYQQDLYLFTEGRLHQGYHMLGSHQIECNGITGIRFAVWAPNAERVSVVGEFNNWDGRIHPMRSAGSSGIWEIFIPDVSANALYRYEIRNRYTGALHTKVDPYAQGYELRPGTASLAAPPRNHQWQDTDWMEKRANWDWLHSPMNVYELHVGSWKRHPDGRFYTYRELAEDLVPYVSDMGYTHVELLPISEHPLDESWGYQTTGYFAPSSRFGSPDDLRYLIDRFHQENIGVILDWVPAHFPQDDWALARYDGTALYEHEDPRMGYHHDWGTHIFNYGRNEVKSFLLSSAYFWLSEFHFDGIRVDAVASMLYLDYSREEGQWLPNKYGGRENLEAVDFLRELNIMIHEAFPGALSMAEESTSWPGVSRPTYLGGLGFSIKWNMGWMNDTLRYFTHEPVHRQYHHHELTFGQLYAYTENFILPFSHDEVVHGKGSLLSRMPGDCWQEFANLRLLLSYQMTNPGKKLNFMGNEFAQGPEWQVQWELEWWQMNDPNHKGIHRLCYDLNHLYRNTPALYDLDFQQEGFAWLDCNDAEQSILSFRRFARDGREVTVIMNLTPVTRQGYRTGVPQNGNYREIFNSDAEKYSGSGVCNPDLLVSEEKPWMDLPCSITLDLPPLAVTVIAMESAHSTTRKKSGKAVKTTDKNK